MLVSLETHIAVRPTLAAVLRLLATGHTDEEIAAELKLRVSTVRARLSRFYLRTGLSGRKVVAWAGRHRECCLAAGAPSSESTQATPLRTASLGS